MVILTIEFLKYKIKATRIIYYLKHFNFEKLQCEGSIAS